jgi:hypothetical protein
MKNLNTSPDSHLMDALKVAQRFTTKGGPDCRVISNPHMDNITITNPNSTFTGDGNCYIACECNEDGALIGEPYIITKEVFKSNYVPKMQGALA